MVIDDRLGELECIFCKNPSDNLYIFNIDNVRFKICVLCLPRYIEIICKPKEEIEDHYDTVIDFIIDEIRNSTTNIG